MKTLEQLVIDTIAQNLQSYKVNAPTAAKIASEIREWMRKQNGGLREVIDTHIATLQAEQPYGVYSINNNQTRENLVDAILSVIPPPRDEMFQSAIAVYESRIKELEAEVERLANLKSSPECCDKAAKYDALREHFPLVPGQVFYVQWNKKIQKRTVWAIFDAGVIDEIKATWNWDECYPTADACRAAIPVEE